MDKAAVLFGIRRRLTLAFFKDFFKIRPIFWISRGFALSP